MQEELVRDEQDLRDEIAQLQGELKDHHRMQLTQEMISVCTETRFPAHPC